MGKAASRLNILIAHKAILISEGLTPTDKSVGGLIIAHFNEDTGQCDPGAARLAATLGIKRQTVFRSIHRLAPLIVRITYGGKSHRNRYVPNWPVCWQIVRAFDSGARLRGKQTTPSQEGHAQPSREGHANSPLPKLDGDLRRRGEASVLSGKGQAGKGNQVLRGFHQIPWLSGTGSHRDAAGAASHRRQVELISRLPKHLRAAAWERAMEEEAQTNSEEGVHRDAPEQIETESEPGK